MSDRRLFLVAAVLVVFGVSVLRAEPAGSSAEPAQAAASAATAKPDPALVAKGKELAKLCDECHTLRGPDKKPVVGEFGGGMLVLPGLYSHNITPGPQGISYYDETLFRQAIREARVQARKLRGMTPALFKKLTDDDLHAIWTYLRTVPAVNHRVDNTEEPTPCKKCRQSHGAGELN